MGSFALEATRGVHHEAAAALPWIVEQAAAGAVLAPLPGVHELATGAVLTELQSLVHGHLVGCEGVVDLHDVHLLRAQPGLRERGLRGAAADVEAADVGHALALGPY